MTCRTLFAAGLMGLALSLASSASAQSPGTPLRGKYKEKTDTPQQPASEGEGGSPGRAKPQSDTEAPPASGDATKPGLLAGPTVEKDAETGRDSPMNSPNNTGKRRPAADQGMPFRQWVETVRGLGLSTEQQQTIAAIATEFQTAQREFQQAHGEEMKQIQQQVRTARESGKEPDAKVRETMQKLEAEMPQQLDYQQRIWDRLTADQQATMRTKLAEMAKRMQEQRRANAAANGGADARRPGAAKATDSPRQPGAEGAGDQMLSPSGTSQRNEPKSTGAESTDEMMGGSEKQAASTETARPAAAAAIRDRRRAAAGGVNTEGLDHSARNRMQFLMQHLSVARAGNAPTPDEKNFKFNEDEKP